MEDRTEILFKRFRKSGKPLLLADVYDSLAPKLLYFAVQVTRDFGEAEDLVHNTFLSAIQQKWEWDANQPLLDWLTQLMVQRHLREPDQIEESLESLDQAAGDRNPVSELQSKEFDETLQVALGSIDEPYQTVLRLKLLERLNSNQIADQLGSRPSTIRSQTARGLIRLRHLLPSAGLA